MAFGDLVVNRCVPHEQPQKPGRPAALVSLPYDIVLLVIQHMGVRDVRSLALVSSTHDTAPPLWLTPSDSVVKLCTMRSSRGPYS